MNIVIRQLVENDLSEAERIYRLSFGTFLGIPDPMTFGRDTNYVKSRFNSAPFAAFAAEVDGKLIGSNFTANWGSVGFFGPLTVHPNYWSQGVAGRLMEPTMQLFSRWKTNFAGLFTFANSPKHVALYQKFGFWPRFLTAIMSKDLALPRKYKTSKLKWSRYSEEVSERTFKDEKHLLEECSKLTNDVYEGLSLESEIRSVKKQNLGDTILLWRQNGRYYGEDSPLTGLAVCHCGAGSEAGSNTCYIKFGAVKSGPDSGRDFENLLIACEIFATELGLAYITAGVNTARHQAYSRMLVNSFRTDMLGIAMQKGNNEGYNGHNIYIIDDWR
jgi:GNAT superfamily N-acetyltransferase